jgi:hypothetical protein
MKSQYKTTVFTCLKKLGFCSFIILSLLSLNGCFIFNLLSFLMSLDTYMSSKEMNENGKQKTFQVSVIEFNPTDCDDPWFCDSKVRIMVYESIIKGVHQVENERSYVKMANQIPFKEHKGFYESLSKCSSDWRCKNDLLMNMSHQYKTNLIIYGLYKGDDRIMLVKPHLYYADRNKIVRHPNWFEFSRSMPENEMKEKLARMIRDLMIETLN